MTRDAISTDPAWKHLLVVDIALHPTHEMLNIFWCWHLGWSLVILRVLPEVFESDPAQYFFRREQRQTDSSVAFISGQDCGEQNSVIEP